MTAVSSGQEVSSMCDEAWLTHLLPPTPCAGLRAAGEHASSPPPAPVRPRPHSGRPPRMESTSGRCQHTFPPILSKAKPPCVLGSPRRPGGTSWLPRVTRLCGQLSLLADLPCGWHLIKNATTEHTEDKLVVARGEGVRRGKVGEGTERNKLPVVEMQE